MTPPDATLYEYAVIRYVPRVDREEFLNIGLIMMDKRLRWLKSKVEIDEKRVKALYPHADIECLLMQSTLFEKRGVPNPALPVEERYRWLTAVKSACLQVSPSHPGLLPISLPSSSKFHSSDPSLSPQTLSKEEILSLLESEFTRLFSLLIL